MARSTTVKAAPAVGYLRVSTREQGDSGLGLAAQKRAVETFCKGHSLRLVETTEEVESGKRNDRPGLHAALSRCKALGAVLVIAKVDRLSRNVGFLFALRDAGVDFRAVDLPELNLVTLAVLGAVAQAEREATSSRTRAALAELKARGKRLGVRRGTDHFGDEGRRKAAARKHELALRRANGHLHTARALKAEGWSYARIAEHLNRSGLKTPRGLEWNLRAVRHLLSLDLEVLK